MAGLLGDVFSAGNVAKRKLRDLLGNPVLGAQQMAGNLNDRARNLNEMTAAAAREGVNYGPATQRLAGLMADAYNPMGLTVFHGSPAKFNRFDRTKIGSGEGAQSYGYGHYVAEAPETANQYKEMLKSKAFSKIVQRDRNVYDVIAPDGTVVSQGTVLGKAHKAKDAYDANVGSIYEIDLPDEQIARMLDWDKPLSRQPKNVQAALEKLGYKVDRAEVDQYSDALLDALMTDAQVNLPKQPMDIAGEALYRKLGSPEQAAQRLREAGIPGIRYLDQGSRSNFMVQNTVKGKPYGEPVSFMTERQAQDYAAEQIEKGFGTEIIPGTSNFVVFPGNEDLLTILRRNGGLLD